MLPLYDAIIIGAGISGLALASRLKSQNKEFIIIEKSAGVGGRIATRRGEDCAYDHGAQFIKIKPSDDGLMLEQLNIQELGKNWFSANGINHFAFPKGMTQFPKSLVSPSNLKLNEKVVHIDAGDDHCLLETEKGTRYQARKVYMTCPLPQSLALLQNSKISYPLELDEIKYASALVGLYRVQSTDRNILDIKCAQDVSNEIFSLNNQLSKEVSQNLAFTVVMQPAWSESRFDQDDVKTLEEISEHFEMALARISSKDSFVILSSQLKKWRYSHPLSKFRSPFHNLEKNKKIFLLGDAFGGGSIPGAIRSAYAIPLTE